MPRSRGVHAIARQAASLVLPRKSSNCGHKSHAASYKPVSPRPFPPMPVALTAAGYQNVCNSRAVPRGVKCAYLSALGRCRLNTRCAKLEHENRRRTAAAFGISLARLSKWVDDWVHFHEKRSRGLPTTEAERLATFEFMGARVPARTDGSIWLFRNPARGQNAFDGLADEWLGHRLGLKLPRRRENRLGIGFLAGRTGDPRRPTYRDVSWQHISLWQWNGFTRPLPGTPTGYSGLEELVAVSPELGQHDGPVIRLKLHGR
jgi:hypothetical protein